MWDLKIGTSETEFNIILNNHCKDINRQKTPQVDQHSKFSKFSNHKLNWHATTIHQIFVTNSSFLSRSTTRKGTRIYHVYK